MANKIIVDTGLETYQIEDKKGNLLGEFSFNPSDVGILTRYEVVADKFNRLMDDVENVDDIENIGKIFADKEKIVKDAIDYLFNAKISDDFFSITSPFTPVANGEFFFENVLNAVGAIVENETGKRVKKIHSKVNKYAVKYHG